MTNATLHNDRLVNSRYRIARVNHRNMRESRDVLVDNTPPVLRDLDVDVSGRKATFTGTAQDAVGPLVGAMISVDARAAKPIVPVDGVLDGPEDKFRVSLGEFSPGEHVAVVRVRRSLLPPTVTVLSSIKRTIKRASP